MVWMDVCEAEQQVLLPRKGGAIAEEIPRPPLVPSEKNNAFSRKTRPTREVPSRYKSTITSSPSLPSTHTVPRRSSSPSVTRTVSSTPLFAKRSVSAERRRPSTPPSPPRPSTPNRDSLNDVQTPSRKGVGCGRTEGLWPSTMRSLCVSFQSDTFSLLVSKKEKPITHEHTLKPSANLGHRQSETPLSQRKTTPERKRTPLRGRNASDQSENSRPLDNSHSRIMDQRWPSRTGGKVSGSALNRSIDFTDKPSRTSSSPLPARGLSPSRKSPARGGLQKAQSGAASQLLFDDLGKEAVRRPGSNNGASCRSSSPFKIGSSNVSIPLNSSERSSSTLQSSRSQSLPTPGSSRPASPSRALSSSPSRGMISPSRGRPNTPFPSVGSVACRSSTSTSVLSFIADVKKGKKGSNHIEDAHQLRLLYNRFMQWRFTNARADAASSIQQIAAERTLYNVWIMTSELWDSVTMKRIDLRELTEELKLNSVLNDQMVYLDDWALLEREHSSSLAEAIEALEACTLRLPVTGGARVDINSLKDAVCSALDVMQAMGSSVCSLQSRVEAMNGLVSALADVTAQERAMLDECVDLLASTVAMEVEENSLRTHLMQLKQSSAEGEHRTSLLGRLV